MNESELLFTEVLNYSRNKLYLDKGRILTQSQTSVLANVLKRRLQGEPIQYILGKIEFMGLEFRITTDVFIPRPETEILIDTAIKLVRSSKFIVHSILDIGTGSGCIAISLAKFLQDVRIYATDISKEVLEVASKNALLNNTKIAFLQSNLFSNDKLQTTNYELIISNPPYITTVEIDNLQSELSYEPRIALDGGSDGLDFYRRIIQGAPTHLKKGGFLIMEMGFSQHLAIKELFNSVEKFEIIEVVKDYNNIERIIVAQLK